MQHDLPRRSRIRNRRKYDRFRNTTLDWNSTQANGASYDLGIIRQRRYKRTNAWQGGGGMTVWKPVTGEGVEIFFQKRLEVSNVETKSRGAGLLKTVVCLFVSSQSQEEGLR